MKERSQLKTEVKPLKNGGDIHRIINSSYNSQNKPVLNVRQ